MQQTTIEEIVKTAEKLHAEDKKWHFHLLSPYCVFNERKDKHAFVLETSSRIFVAYSENRLLNEGKKLAHLLLGNEITEGQASLEPLNEVAKICAQKARALNQEGKEWHHHVLYPGCVFNKHEGKWVIFFEDQEENKNYEAVYGEEPKQDLQAMETLYYKQKK